MVSETLGTWFQWKAYPGNTYWGDAVLQNLPTDTIGVESLHKLHRALAALGADPEVLRSEVGLSKAVMESYEKQVPLALYRKLWKVGSDIVQRPDIGLQVGSFSSPYHCGIVGLLFLASPTLNEGMQNVGSYYANMVGNVGFRLRVEEDCFIISHHFRDGPFNIPDIERDLVGTFNWIKAFRRHATYTLKAHFSFERPDYIDTYREKLGCTPQFNQAENAIHYPISYLEQRNPEFNPYSYQILLERAEALAQSFSQSVKESTDQFVTRLQSHIREMMSKETISASKVASAFNISQRSFYRELAKRNLKFQDLVDNARKEKSIELMRHHNLPLKHICYQVGFSDYASFSRAFKRWTGKGVSEFSSRIQK